MLHEIYLAIYRMPFLLLAVITAAFLVLAVLAHVFLPIRAKRIIGIIATAFILAVILYITLIGRAEPETGLVLMPGYSIRRAFISDEYLRMVLMNIFVFIPYGTFLSLALSGIGRKGTVLITLLSGLVFTLTIETLQYILDLGCAETDDVICNAFGVFAGLIPFLVTYRTAHKRI